MWSTSHFAQDSLEVAERRTHTRTPVSPPIYASLDNINGGLIFNMTEEGLALTAAMTVSVAALLVTLPAGLFTIAVN